MALPGHGIGKHRQLGWCLLQSGEFQPRIGRRSRRRLGCQRFGVAGGEDAPHFGAKRFVIDNDKSPRLAQSDRRSETGKLNEGFEGAGRQRLVAETTDVAAPDQKIAQPHSESFIEGYRVIGNQGIFSD